MIGPVQDLADDLSEVASTWSACQQRTANLEEEIELVRESMQSLVEAIEDEARARRIVILEQEATARAREADSDRAAQREAVLGRALQEAGRRTDAAETELRNIYGSRSWRVAKTLRTIRRPL
jgi:predicted DCC family thiol-disulfide oxidoreductase YuxK